VGVDFAIEFEPRQPSLSEVTEEEIVQHYRASVPSGNPPLSAIREHVVRALAVARGTEPDPIAALHDRFVDQFGRYRIWFDADLEKLAKELGVTPLQRFQRDPGAAPIAAGEFVFDSPEEEQAWLAERERERQRHTAERGPGWNAWCAPADGLRSVRALHAAIAPSAQDQRACLALLEEMLAIAEREQRRFRVLAFW
jgi:hypothetical protein